MTLQRTKEEDVLSKKDTPPFLILLGNEKGGTGKSTLAMHIITGLLYDGFSVASIDLDGRQGTLSRYIENRKIYGQKETCKLPTSPHFRLMLSGCSDQNTAHEINTKAFHEALEGFSSHQFIVIDTPGSDTPLSRYAHSFSDVLITPMNDSFVDLDLLVQVSKSVPQEASKLSAYSEMVWEQKKEKAARKGRPIHWIVCLNRVGSLRTKNREHIDQVLKKLAKRIGFKICPGFGERVIFRELFTSGLTLLDMEFLSQPLTFSHVTARHELRALLSLIPLPQGDLSPTDQKSPKKS